MKKVDLNCRLIATLFLFITLLQIFGLSKCYALTYGPGQREYSSYESSGSRDIVDLLKGDLNVNIPLLEVPGPEGGISIPMFYHSGVGVFDESTWVGLGWNVNLGAIARNVVGYPDDYVGHIGGTANNAFNIRSYQAGGSSWVKDYFFYQRFWDSEKGYSGRISLFNIYTVTSDGGLSGINDVSVLGVHSNAKGLSVNLDEAVQGVMTVAAIGMAAVPGGQAAAIGIGLQLAAMTASGFASVALSNGNLSGSSRYLFYNTNKARGSNKTETTWWYQYKQDELAYGSLYLGQMSNPPTPITSTCADANIAGNGNSAYFNYTFPKFQYYLNSSTGYTINIGSDMHFTNFNSQYPNNLSPTSISYDGYSVSGPGTSGLISPYRMDVGSLTTQKRTSFTSCKLNPVQFVDENANNYKVQFRYPGFPSNSVTHHRGIDNSGSSTNSGNLDVNVGAYSYAGQERMYYDFSPNIYNINTFLKADSYIKKRKSFGRNIEWFTNSEMNSQGPNSPIGQRQIIDFNNATQRSVFRSNLPSKGIGGFAITTEDGTTYHYSLPVYNLRDFEFKANLNNQASSYAYKLNTDPFATNWLLTAITGSDFIDRGEIGYIDDNGSDYGFWVKFEYGKFASNYHWRLPYTDFKRDKSDQNQGYVSGGSKQTYYLNTIKTKSHTAIFIKDIKNDGRSFYGDHQIDNSLISITSNGVNTNINSFTSSAPSSSLLLDRIVLLSNSDYNSLISQGLTTVNPSSSNESKLKTSVTGCTFDNVYDAEDFSGAIGASTIAKMIQKVGFKYDYSLCSGTSNSYSTIGIPATKTGKLTLKSVQFLGRNDVKLFPDFTFNYAYANPAYNYLSYDGWGMYNPNTASNALCGTSSSNNSVDHTAWNLSSMTTPTGSVVTFDLEKDAYENVSGVPLSSINTSVTYKYGGDVRVKSITIEGENGTQYKTRYLYGKGAVAQEPSEDKMYDNDLFKYFDYPFTPVMYGNVKTLTGKLSTDIDYESMTEYEFLTPSLSYLTSNATDYFRGTVNSYNTGNMAIKDHLHLNYSISNYNSQIGKVKSIKSYTKGDKLNGETIFNYTSNRTDKLGIFTEGTFMGEIENDNYGSQPSTYRLFRTSKTYYPSILQSVINKKNGLVTSITNMDSYDFITGIPLVKTVTNSINKSNTEVIIPAYNLYPDMGSKGSNIANKHMLSQVFANYIYISNDPNKVLAANVQTWSNSWTYREISNGQYLDIASIGSSEQVFRKKAAYIWKTNNLNIDGTFPYPAKDVVGNNLTEINYLNCSSCKWLKTSENTRYDHYSRPLEVKDVNNNYSSTKLGYNDLYPIASASLATYNSFFHTSFEDLNTGWFGGEIGQNSGTQKTIDGSVLPHTGAYFVKIDAGTNYWGPMSYYKTGTGNNSGIESGRTYRASVWVHSSSNPNAALFFSYDGSTSGYVEKKLSDAGAVVATVGNWSLIRLDATLPSTYVSSGSTGYNDVRIGVKGGSTGLPSYFDDLRLHPIESSISGTTYDNLGRVEYTLNQDNFYTKYVYNTKGQLAEVWQETPTKGVKMVKKYSQHFQGE